jgi:hypothetical protein
MKVLLIGADRAVRERRRELLQSAGYDAFAIPADDADAYMADPEIGCLVLGSTLGEQIAELLASQFTALRENRLVIRIVEIPVATNYPYAHFVVSPQMPNALLAAVKAAAIRLSQKT